MNFTIVPKNKKLLKSSKVRAYLRSVEKAMQPAANEVQAAAEDLFIYGTGAVFVKDDGTVKRVDPKDWKGEL